MKVKMKSKIRNFLVAALTLTMIMGSSSMVFAESAVGNETGEGTQNVVSDSDVFRVSVPANASDQFDYVLDPQGVISDTDAERYGGDYASLFESGKSMYFKHVTSADGFQKLYSNLSAPIKAINKGTSEVNISVEAVVTNDSGATVTTANAVTTSPGEADPALINFQVVEVNGVTAKSSTAKDVTGNGEIVTSDIAETPGAYQAKYVTGDEYKMELKDEYKGSSNASKFESYAFALTGSCNKSNDWKSIKTANLPTVKLVWTVNGSGTKVEDADDGAIFSTGQSKYTITYNANNVDSITKVMMNNDSGNAYDIYAKNGTYWVAASSSTSDGIVTVTFFGGNDNTYYNDTATREATVTYKDKDGNEKTEDVVIKLQ